MKSEIISFLNSIPENDCALWTNKFEELKISVKEDGDLAIFNYGVDADFSNPIVREARGIIIDMKQKRIVARGFDKFFNVQELYAATIDWTDCRVEEKVDGSIIKLWWRNGWHWSTNSCIDAYSAPTSDSRYTFGDIIRKAVNYKDIPFDSLNKNYTYIFELVSPETQVIVRYPVPKLFHIGTRDNNSGVEYRFNIGIDRPKVYSIKTLEDCLEAARHLNQNGDEIKKEGFVVVDHNWNRVKVKSPEYVQMHYLWNNGKVSKKEALMLLREHSLSDLDGHDMMLRFSVLMHYYAFKLKELEYNVARYIDYVRGLYEEYNHDRKAVALEIMDHKYATFGFAAIDNDVSAAELIQCSKLSLLCKLIPEYYEENVL